MRDVDHCGLSVLFKTGSYPPRPPVRIRSPPPPPPPPPNVRLKGDEPPLPVVAPPADPVMTLVTTLSPSATPDVTSVCVSEDKPTVTGIDCSWPFCTSRTTCWPFCVCTAPEGRSEEHTSE